MGLKENLQKRIEKNAHESICTWIDSDGKEHTEKVIMKRSLLPLVGDWGRIYPPINEDGSINWINAFFGGKKNLIKLLFILIVVAIFLLGAYDILSQNNALLNNQCVVNCFNKIIPQIR